jgi:cobalt-precorrin-5B (C1)-methyltransferase
MKQKRLRFGFTTGSAATAAAKAALMYLITGRVPDRMEIRLPEGKFLDIPIHGCTMKGNMAECTVIKDAGDDPDITDKAVIGARVGFSKQENFQDNSTSFFFPWCEDGKEIVIRGGEGVGRVTKPGLGIPVGDWAINAVPRKMIGWNIQDVTEKLSIQFREVLCVEIFVPDGEKLARKTLNPRLGIEGGISILGTTGIVHPMSHDAYRTSISLAMDVAKAVDQKTLVFSTGRRSERFAMSYWQGIREEAFVQIGDYFEFSLGEAVKKRSFNRVNMAVFFGKALKMACGMPQTHASQAAVNFNELSLWTYDVTHNEELSNRVRNSNTAREALERIKKEHGEVVRLVGRRMIESACRFSGNLIEIQGIMFDFNGEILFNSEEVP